MAKEVDINGFWTIKDNPLSKVGVFSYLGNQISDELEADKIYKVYRPLEELLNDETVKSFNGVPFIDEHEMLGENFTPAEKKGVDGVVIDTFADKKQGILKGTIKLFSEKIKDEIVNGKKELSMGYFCDYELRSGSYKGEKYDAVQREIRGNHVALVDKGRMGSDVRVYDRHITFDRFDIFDYNENHSKENGRFISGSGSNNKENEKKQDRKAINNSVIKITGKELGEYKDIKELRDKSIEYYRENLQGKSVENKELGKVLFSRKGLDKYKNASADTNKLKMVVALKNIIENGEYLGEKKLYKKRDDGIVKFHRISKEVKLDNKTYKTEILISEDREGNKFYDLMQDMDEYNKKRGFIKDPTTNIGGDEASNNSKSGTDNNIAQNEKEVNIFFIKGEDNMNEKLLKKIIETISSIIDDEDVKAKVKEALQKLGEADEEEADDKDDDTEKKEKTEDEEEKKEEKKEEKEEIKDEEKDDEKKGLDSALQEKIKNLEKENKNLKKAIDELPKNLFSLISQRDKLAVEVSKYIGTFDSSNMSPKEVAIYACKKLELKVAEDEAESVLKGYLKAQETNSKLRVVIDTDGNNVSSENQNQDEALKEYLALNNKEAK
ncbi:MAG: DUF2213 domain-containing protein [Elusimicrobiota bacterium]|jgi:hypothetical protein|nr:DUF2213 domain-containing protein [Elusimicrobiota bacterium]